MSEKQVRNVIRNRPTAILRHLDDGNGKPREIQSIARKVLSLHREAENENYDLTEKQKKILDQRSLEAGRCLTTLSDDTASQATKKLVAEINERLGCVV